MCASGKRNDASSKIDSWFWRWVLTLKIHTVRSLHYQWFGRLPCNCVFNRLWHTYGYPAGRVTVAKYSGIFGSQQVSIGVPKGAIELQKYRIVGLEGALKIILFQPLLWAGRSITGWAGSDWISAIGLDMGRFAHSIPSYVLSFVFEVRISSE